MGLYPSGEISELNKYLQYIGCLSVNERLEGATNISSLVRKDSERIKELWEYMAIQTQGLL